MKIKGNKVGFFAFFLCSVFCMVMIFMFSYQSAEQSTNVSVSYYDLFIEFTGFDFITHNAFRKIAHFCEFAALGFSVCGTVFFYLNKFSFKFSLIFCVFYSLSDEIHQLFVPERAGRLLDVFVDSCGSLFGIAVFYLIILIYNKILKC